MSDEGSAKMFEADKILQTAAENLEKELQLIGVFIEGKYQVDGITAARFVLKSLSN